MVREPEPPRKRVKLEQARKSVQPFIDVEEIRASLRTQNTESLIEALTTLRNQLTVRSGNDTISPQDERLLFAQRWMEYAPAAQDLFGIWESINQRQHSILALLLSCMSALLGLLTTHYTFQNLGHPVLKTLLSAACMRRLNSYLGGSHTELILATLKLFNAMSGFASGRERKSILEAFAWETKSLPKLLNMRRKAKINEHPDPLRRPDIRTLYISFILSFVDANTAPQVKAAFLEQHRDAFLSIFKGLIQDSYPVAREVLETCWAGIWSDPKVKRTVKIGLFNEATISHIAKLYDRVANEDVETEQIPADLVHHFLLAICTRPGSGICFQDRGWFPRESDEDERTLQDDNEYTKLKGGRIYNKILSNVLRTLKINEDSRQQELALKIMSACPELVAGYWSAAGLTLEPRLSSKWITNISFLASVISLPVPVFCFFIPNSTTLFQPLPPPMSTILENIFPTANTKNYLSKGLQSTSGLVQHCTALTLVKCLVKYEKVKQAFRSVERALEEDEDGQWSKRRKDIEREIRRRVPDLQVVLAFSQQRAALNETKAALLSESAQRLLWLYHRCLPSLVAESRFDVGKLLQKFSDSQMQGKELLDAATRLNAVCQIHTLRLLKESEQFTWTGKIASGHTYLHVLLKGHSITDISAMRTTLTTLLRHILSESILFQEDPNESYLWLKSLPTMRRSPHAEAPDGAALTDEGDSVINFLDDCVQRCLKTPYRYIEEIHAFNGSPMDIIEPHDIYPSPLIVTVLEQLDAKIRSKLLSASDVLAISSFMRRLMYRLSSKLSDLHVIRAVATKMDGVLQPDQLFPQYLSVTAAIRREVRMMLACLHEQKSTIPQSNTAKGAVHDFLNQIEQVPVPTSDTLRISCAFELVDWLRFIDQPLSSTQLNRLIAVVERFHKPTLKEVVEHLGLTQTSLWDSPDSVLQVTKFPIQADFEWLFIQSGEIQFADAKSRGILTKVLFAGGATLFDIKGAIGLILHRLAAPTSYSHNLLLLLASIMKQSSSSLSSTDFALLKEQIFLNSKILQGLCTSTQLNDLEIDGICDLLKTSLDPTDVVDRKLIDDLTAYWLSSLKRVVQHREVSQLNYALLWIHYMEPADLFILLDFLSDNVGGANDVDNTLKTSILTTTLIALRPHMSTAYVEASLRMRLSQLLTLRSLVVESSILEDMIATAIDAFIPVSYNGLSLLTTIGGDETLASLTTRAEDRWSGLRSPLAEINVHPFLVQSLWTESTVHIVSKLLYRRSYSRDLLFQWFDSPDCARLSMSHLVPILHAYLDTAVSCGDTLGNTEKETLISFVSRLLGDLTKPQGLREHNILCGSSFSLLVVLLPSESARLLELLVQSIRTLPVTCLNTEIVAMVKRLQRTSHPGRQEVVTILLDLGLQWAIEQFTSGTGQTEGAREILAELTFIIKTSSIVKSPLVETALATAIQHQLNDISALRFISALVQTAQLKPLVANRYLQSILQHPQYMKLCRVTGPALSTRESIIHLLYILFNLHPWNTCQPTHVEPLVQIYGGTLSRSDRQLLAIFKLFEIQRKTSIASILSRWSSSSETSPSALDAIQSIDAVQVLRTCLAFPKWRFLEEKVEEVTDTHDAQLYDPVFLILLFAKMLADSPPVSAFAWVDLFRTNIVSLLVRCMSAKDGKIREVALCQIAGLWKHTETADMQEKPHVLYILNLLKDVIPQPSSGPPLRLPSYTTLILLHALRGIFYPSNFIYPLTARFLLQRPEVDINDVPMLYSMLYSSSDDWKKERGWIIRFLSDGMVSTDDWRVFKRRHTWDLLASMFQSSEKDRALRSGVLDVLANLTRNSQAMTSLILKSGLLRWVEMQLQSPRDSETFAWIKILENIVLMTDAAKLESSTHGEWRFVICRCLNLLLGEAKNATVSLDLITPVILKLSLLPGPPIFHLPALVEQAANYLRRLEAEAGPLPLSTLLKTLRTHPEQLGISASRSVRGLVESSDNDGYVIRVWGKSVENLWRVSMALEEKCPAWDMLTSRLLVWRSMVGKEGSIVGEWARTSVAQMQAST